MQSICARIWLPIAVVCFLPAAAQSGMMADFDDLTLDPESYWNGSDGSGSFQSGNMVFLNSYNSTYDSWSGWAYSNMTDTTTAGYINQYSAFTGGGQGESTNYAVAYESIGPPRLAPADGGPAPIAGVWLTNTTYAALSMLQGDQFAKKFGGATGNDPDWFQLAITGYDVDSEPTGTVDFYLADYRSEDPTLDYVVDDWTWVDLSALGEVTAIDFQLSSSDTGEFGMNTPAYFAMDSVGLAPGLLLGDMNGDGHVDGLDVDPFVAVLVAAGYQVAGDMNEDGHVDGLDVDPFVTAVSEGGGRMRAVPEPASSLLAGIALLAAIGLCGRRNGRFGLGRSVGSMGQAFVA